MTPDELEFSISQYVDGTLSAEESAALEMRLANDPSARRMLEEYRKLSDHLTGSMPLPGVRWDRLAEHLSSVVSEAEQPGVAGRIRPARWAMPARLSIAASVILVIGVGLLLHRGTQPIQTITVVAPSVGVVNGPEAELPVGPTVVEIKVGPSPALAAREDSWRYGEGVVTRPSHVELAGGDQLPPDEASHIH